MSILESSNPTIAGLSIPTKLHEDLKIAFINMIEALKEEMNKCLKEIYENTNNEK